MFEALRAAGGVSDLRLFHGMPHEFVRLPGMMDVAVGDVESFSVGLWWRRGEFAVALGEARVVWAERVAVRG